MLGTGRIGWEPEDGSQMDRMDQPRSIRPTLTNTVASSSFDLFVTSDTSGTSHRLRKQNFQMEF